MEKISQIKMQTPIVLIIFNRQKALEKVFEAIRSVKPSRLLVIADGSRNTHPDDVEKCAATRKVIEGVDWDCEVSKNYSDTNLGIKKRVTTGLNWVFQQVEEAIILEDDCLPHSTFFQFCEELLDKYRHDERITTISGNNFQFGRRRTDYSYYYSRYTLIWGWATWRRAWQNYDMEMKHWIDVRDGNWLEDILQDSKAVKYWNRLFEGCYEGKIDTWDFAWTFASWIQNGLTILPNINLVSNIGFNPKASNTKDIYSPFAYNSTEPMEFPLKHPPFVIRDTQADDFTQRSQFDIDVMSKVRSKAHKVLSRLNF